MAAVRWRPWQADLVLLAVAAVWGATFPVVKQATAQVPVFWFLAVRFDLAAAALAVLCGRQALRAPWRTWAAGLGLGTLLFAGYALQTLGLGLTTAAKAGFLTGLYAALTPLVSGLWLRRWPPPQAWAGVAVAMAGLALLTLDGSLVPSRGDLLVLGCAVAFAAHIVGVARCTGDAGAAGEGSQGVPPSGPVGDRAPASPTPADLTAALAVAQMAATALLSHLVSALLEPWPRPVPPGVWPAVALCGLLASAAAFWLQTALQPYTTPTHTALVFATEPVWAALFALALLGEALNPRGYLGGALVLAGVLLAELPLGARAKAAPAAED